MTQSLIFLLIALVSQQYHWNTDANSVLIDGYDVVSYFEGKAEQGSADFKYDWKGATFYFASKKHLEDFRVDPEKYAPQYGGYCAYAIGDSGEKVSINPETFKITNGKLYLFYHTFSINTLKLWNKDEDELRTKADMNWQANFVDK